MSPPSVADANGNATLDSFYYTGGPIPDVETGAFRAAIRAKMAMTAHQSDEEMVTAHEVGEQLAFAVKESLAVVAVQFGFPAEMPPALIAVLANLNVTLIQEVKEQGDALKDQLIQLLNKQVDDVKGQMKKQGDDLKDQLIQLKKQVEGQIKEQGDNLQDQVIQLNKQVDDVKGQMKKQGDDLKDQLIALKKQVDDVKGQMKKQGDDLQDQLIQLNKQVDDLEGQTKKQRGDVQGQLLRLRMQVNDVKGQMKKQGNDVKGQLIQLNKQVDDVKGQLKEQGDVVQGLLIQVKKQGDDVHDELIQLKQEVLDDVNDHLAMAEHRHFERTRQLKAAVLDAFGVAQRRLGNSGRTAPATSSSDGSLPTRMATALSALGSGSPAPSNANDETGATPSTASTTPPSTSSSPGRSASEGDSA